MHCIFCEDILREQVLMETASFQVVLDIDPIQQGHLLIMTKEHVMDVRALSDKKLLELLNMEKALIDLFEVTFKADGVSILQNNGAIMDEGTHFHVHVVPRYKDDEFWEHQKVNERALSIELLKNKLQQLHVE